MWKMLRQTECVGVWVGVSLIASIMHSLRPIFHLHTLFAHVDHSPVQCYRSMSWPHASARWAVRPPLRSLGYLCQSGSAAPARGS